LIVFCHYFFFLAIPYKKIVKNPRPRLSIKIYI
jgi:hypothetical protein